MYSFVPWRDVMEKAKPVKNQQSGHAILRDLLQGGLISNLLY